MAKELVKLKRSKEQGYVDTEVYDSDGQLIGIHTSLKTDSVKNVRDEVDYRFPVRGRAAEKTRLEAVLAGL